MTEEKEEIKELSEIIQLDNVDSGASGFKDTKIVGYILDTENEEADKVIIGGGADDDEFYDGMVGLIDENTFEWKGQTHEVKKSALHVDKKKSLMNPEKRFVIFWKKGNRNPITFKEPGVFGASDLKIIRNEETTLEGITNAITGGGPTGSRTKMIMIFGAIFVVVALAMFVLPKFVPFLEEIPIFGW